MPYKMAAVTSISRRKLLFKRAEGSYEAM